MGKDTGKQKRAGAVGSTRLVGRCVEVGDDDEGQPRLKSTPLGTSSGFASNSIYAEVEVMEHAPDVPAQRPPGTDV